jgi:hypothetical protein
MAREIAEIEAEIRELPRAEQERLLTVILEALEGPADPDVERLWMEEAQRRSREFDAGLTKCVPADEAIARIRARLQQ